MGATLHPIPFWTDTIEVRKVHSASRQSDFQTRTLSDLGEQRLAYASLYHIPERNTYYLKLRGGEFIEFEEGR